MTDDSDLRISAAKRKFGARVRAVRKQRGWTLRTLAGMLGVHWTYLGMVERGEREIRLGNVLALAVALRIDPGVLLAGLVAEKEDAVSTTDTFAPPGRTESEKRPLGSSERRTSTERD